MTAVPKLIALLIYISTFFLASHSYILDKSCDDFRPQLTEWMKEAFHHAQSGQDLFENIADAKPSYTRRAQEDLLQYVFKIRKSRRGRFDTRLLWPLVTSVFKSVLLFNKNEDGAPSPEPDYGYGILRNESRDVAVFCNFSRFDLHLDCDKIEDPPNYCDTAYNETIHFTEPMFRCMNRHPNSPLMMYFEYDDIPLPSQIQLCTAYIDYLMEPNTYKAVEDFRRLLPRARDHYRIEGLDIRKPAIDLAGNAVDVNLLYHMTSAIEEPYNVFPAQSYGWHHVTRPNMLGPRTANNYAYFGMIASLITPKTADVTPMRVNQDGFVEVIPPQVMAKRDIDNSTQYQL